MSLPGVDLQQPWTTEAKAVAEALSVWNLRSPIP